MKYGENINQISVPKWNIHNVDYNSLKEAIKINTKKDEAKAKAIAIPGQLDTSRSRFESELFEHLHHEHDRVNLFVLTKAQELSRRLKYLSDQIHRLAIRCNQSSRTSQKRHTRLLRCEQDLLQVGEDIANLPRFVYAQAEAFRKITKKYKKWTGSSSLGERFRFEVLGSPKSFTHLDFSALKSQFEHLLENLRSITPQTSLSPTPVNNSETTSRPGSATDVFESLRLGRPQISSLQQRYWNEYEHGSEAGEDNGEYVIWVTSSDDDNGFLPEKFLSALMKPFSTIRCFFSCRPDAPVRAEGSEQTPLLTGDTSSLSYAAIVAATPIQDSDDDEDSTSDDEFQAGYEARYASLPSVNEQRIELFRNNALFRGTLGLFSISSVLLMVASILVSTGRHKMKAEVDAGVTIGVATALACTFIALAMFLLRTDKSGLAESLLVCLWFVLLCAGSGALLVLVVDGLS